MGKLSNFWRECSNLCHIGWPLACSVPDVRKIATAGLTEMSESLSAYVSSLGWPVLQESAFAELRNRFIAGKASAEDVLAHIQQTGLWARAEFPDGTPSRFIGEPVPPSAPPGTT